MATYKKKLKRNTSGKIPRYVGTNKKGYAEKFNLGYNLEEAKRRLMLIKILWAEFNLRNKNRPWRDDYLRAAKAIAKGTKALFPSRGQGEAPEWYLERLAGINRASNGAFKPTNEDDYDLGITEARETLKKTQKALSNGTGKVRTGITIWGRGELSGKYCQVVGPSFVRFNPRHLK